jgi:hypothetical protein
VVGETITVSGSITSGALKPLIWLNGSRAECSNNPALRVADFIDSIDPKQTVVGLEIFEDIAARIRLGPIAVGS